jgi:excisionase family DNA binding protein
LTAPAAGHTSALILSGDIDLSDFAFLTTAEVAEVMRVSRMTVYRMIKAGELPSTKVGQRGYRVPAQAVREYLTIASTAPEPEPTT